MNRTVILLLIGLASAIGFSACGPTTYTMNVELRQPSISGFDLVGKNMSVVFLDSGESGDSVFMSALSGSFADKLDQEYFGGDSSVVLYSLPKREGVVYEHRDSMVNLLVETGSDVVFLFDSPDFEGVTLTEPSAEAGGRALVQGILPCVVTLYVYDGMRIEDRVYEFHGKKTNTSSAYVHEAASEAEMLNALKENMVLEAENMGGASASRFKIRWKSETTFFYIFSSERWYESYYAVADYRWQDAMDIWMSMLDTKNLQKKACLEYNLATACYILGQYELADEWIKLSAKDFDLSLTEYLAHVISSKL